MMDDERRAKDYTPEQYFKSSDEMADLFADIPEALSNTIAIAEMCNFGFENTDHVLPDFETPKDLSIDEYLEQQANVGLKKIFPSGGDNLSTYQKRLDDEIKSSENRFLLVIFLLLQILFNGLGSKISLLVPAEDLDLDP
ncbi:MAG: hypothetical protein Ct9H90mP13_04450 [Pseudomonadota bacterium]|nr:MAG: hypothetical protein Ct9H90mP13_04450 [Pseudomonadota bacterium]